jgi:hypothetical protein
MLIAVSVFLILVLAQCNVVPNTTAANVTPISLTPIPATISVTAFTETSLPFIVLTPSAMISNPIDEEPRDGLVSVNSSGDGITLILLGTLSRETFLLDSVEVVGSRLAGRSSDPDQFRVLLLGLDGQAIDTIAMWSPLTQFEWDINSEQETLYAFTERKVDIPIPVSIDVEIVILSWPDEPEIANIQVGNYIRKFCDQTPENPACQPR